MIPTVVHLFGPFYIRSYGVCIALGLITTLWLANRDPKRTVLLDDNQFITLFLWSIAAALLGGRILYLIVNWNTIENVREMLHIWSGGFSILGSIIAVLGSISWYARKQFLSVCAVLDFFAVYAPLLQSISRIGCFFAGCCYGKATLCPISLTYNHPDSMAPVFIPLHPTQLYSALTLFFIYLVLSYVKKHTSLAPGHLVVLYLLLVSFERFFIDFLRADQEFLRVPYLGLFSIHQWLALIIISATLGYLSFVAYTKKYESI